MLFSEGIKKVKDNKLVFITGEETYYKDQLRHTLIKLYPKLDNISFDCDEVDISLIKNTLSVRDLFNPMKLIFLKNIESLKDFDYFIKNKYSDVIVFDLDKDPTAKKYASLKKSCLHLECKKPKLWEEESDIASKALGFFKLNGYSITEDTARYLYQNIGYNLYRLSHELQKLVLFKENEKEITEQDIDKISLKNMNYNVFDIIDEIIRGNKNKALLLLSKVYKYEKTPGILLINLWYNHFENLLFLKTMSKTNEEAAAILKIPLFLITKKYSKQANILDISKIIQSLQYLTNMDFNLRKGSLDLKLYIEQFILNF